MVGSSSRRQLQTPRTCPGLMKEGGQDNVDCVSSLGGPLAAREQEKGMAFAILLSSTRLAMTSALAASF